MHYNRLKYFYFVFFFFLRKMMYLLLINNIVTINSQTLHKTINPIFPQSTTIHNTLGIRNEKDRELVVTSFCQ